MSDFLYIVLSFFDAIAILALIFKFFRFPFWEYSRELAIIGTTITIISYLMRVEIGTREFDLVVQILVYVLFLRYLIKFKLIHSIVLTAIGSFVYTLIQIIVVSLLLFMNIVSTEDAQSISNMGTYIIQITSQLAAFVISWVLFKFNRGFSFIMLPPHDFMIKLRLNGLNTAFLVGGIIGLLVIPLIFFWFYNFLGQLSFIFLTVLFILLMLLITASKKDRDDI